MRSTVAMTFQMTVRLKLALTDLTVGRTFTILNLDLVRARILVVVKRLRTVATHLANFAKTLIPRRNLALFLQVDLDLPILQYFGLLAGKAVRGRLRRRRRRTTRDTDYRLDGGRDWLRRRRRW